MAPDNTIEAYRAEYPDADDRLLRAYMAEDEWAEGQRQARRDWYEANKDRVWCERCWDCDFWNAVHDCKYQKVEGKPKITRCPMREIMIAEELIEPGDTLYEKGERLEVK